MFKKKLTVNDTTNYQKTKILKPNKTKTTENWKKEQKVQFLFFVSIKIFKMCARR